MNILILTKLKNQILEPHHKTVEDYVKDELFFNGFNEGFKNLGHKTFLNWEESFFVPQKLKVMFPFFVRVLKYAMRRVGLSKLDRYLFSKKIAFFCKKNSIDMIFTEINAYISPNILKKFYPEVIVTQWYGIFPEMSDIDTLNILSEYDYVWGPCEFDRAKVDFEGIEKLHYIGSGVNEQLFFYDYDENFSHDIVFVGGIGKAHSNRIEILEKIAQNFENFVFYGYGIENVPTHYKLRERYKGWINPKELRKLFSSSKIALNLTLDGYDRVKKGFNARLFEIAACGGTMQLCRYDEKIKEFFDIGKDLDCFEGSDDVVEKISFYLENKEKRKMLVKGSLLKINQYTYSKKAEKMMKLINKI